MSFVIKTKRLELVPLSMKYLESTFEYVSDKETCKYMMYMPYLTIEETKEYLKGCEKNFVKNESIELAVIYNNIHIGSVFVFYEESYGEIGWIINKKYQRNGFAYEACVALIDYVFLNTNISKLVAHCDNKNIASSNLMEKLGFKLVDVCERIYRDDREKSKEYKYELKKTVY